LFTENRLIEPCVKKLDLIQLLLTFDETEYDKFVTNIFDQNLKDEIPRIKNFCGITTSANPESFKLTLSQYITEEMSVYEELVESIFQRK